MQHAQAAISFVNSSSNNNDGSSGNITHVASNSATSAATNTLTISFPAGTAVNDVMIAQIARRGGAPETFTAPAGWTLVGTNLHLAGSGSNSIKHRVYYKVTTASDLTAGNATWTFTGNQQNVGGISSYRNVDTTNPIHLNSENSATSNGTSISATGFTTTVDGTMLIAMYGINGNKAYAGPAGYSASRYEQPSGTNNIEIRAVDLLQATAGGTGNPTTTWTGNNNRRLGVLVALNPVANSLSLDVPSGTAEDHVMIAAIAVRPSSITIGAPSGWTLIRRTNQGTGNSNSQALYYRVATASEPASYTWTFSSGSHTGAVGGILSYSGVDTANPIDVENGVATANNTSHTAPSITTTVANAMLITTHSYSSAQNWTPPGGMTERVDIFSTAAPAGGGIAIEMNDESLGAAGATGTRTAIAAGSADTGVAQSVALTPIVVTNTITANFSANLNAINAGSISILDASLGDPEATATNTNTNNATITTNITTLTNNAWVIDTVGSGNGGTFTPNGGQTERWDTNIGSATAAMSTKELATSALTSMIQTHSTTSNRTAHTVISVAPYSSSSMITFDAAASTNTTNATSISWSHTLSTLNTTNTKLIVGIGFEEAGACNDTIDSVTYGNIQLTQVAQAQISTGGGGGTCQQVEIWYADLTNIIVSTNNDSTLGGQDMSRSEAVEYNAADDSGTLFLDDAVINGNPRVDAIHAMTNGNIALSVSTNAGATVDGTSFEEDDIVEVTSSGTFVQELFSEDNFTSAEDNGRDIDAVYIRNNGNIVLSVANNESLPGIGNFDDDDIVEWNGTTASLVFNIASITGAANNWDVDAVHFLNDDPNLILFSLWNNRTIGPTTYNDGDVLLYNRNTSTLSVYFAESNYTSGNEDTDAVTLAVQIVTQVVDHYAISYPLGTPGVTCEALAVRITAHGDPTDHTDIVSPSSTTTITLSTSPAADSWALRSGGGTFTPPNQYQFDGSETFVDLWLTETTATTAPHIDIDVTDGTATDDDGDATEDANIQFAEAVFRFFDGGGTGESIETQIAGKESDINPSGETLQLRSVITNTSTMACESRILNLQTIEMAYKCNNPTTCQGAPRVQIENAAASTFDITPGNNNAATVDATNGNYDNVDLNFGATGTATFSFDFNDVGQITLYAREVLVASAPDPAITVFGASNTFVVKPFGFDVQVTGNPAASGPGGTRFTGAGEDFTVTARAVAWNSAGDSNNDGVPDNHDDTDPSNNVDLSNTTTYPTTPNFGQEGSNEATDEDIDLNALLNQPNPGNDPGLVGETITSFTSGSGSNATVNYDEVGIIEIRAEVAGDQDYLGGGVVLGKSGYVGRFSPYVFEATTPTPPVFGPTCGTFSYIGQGFTYTTAPVINLTARAQGVAPAFGSVTQNYTGTFLKLTDAKLLADGNKTYAAATGTLDTSLVPTPDPVIADTGSGTATLTFSAGTGIGFNRGNPQDPFDADIALSINVLDTDDIFAGNGSGVNQNPVSFGTATAGNGISFGGNKEQRWGRLVLDNTFGSELLPLELPVRTEYQSNGDFITNTDDSCTNYNSTNITFSNHSGITAGANLTASGSGTLVNGVDDGANPLILNNTLPEVGFVDATHSIDFWLDFDWDNDTNHDDDPTARATWGIFSGPEEFIYIREPW